MNDEDLAAFAAWLRQTQGIDMDPTALREPAGAAAKLGALVGEAAAELPFGAEPSGFDAALTALSGGDGDDG